MLAALDIAVANKQQHRAGAIQGRVDHWIDRVLFRNHAHAAGLVVRRLTITNARPNMNSENNTRVASEDGRSNIAGLAGVKQLAQSLDPVGEGIDIHQGANPEDAPTDGEQRS